ncbi:DUF6531 domain-containing protein [Enterovibrio makurazakiensis]|uniref:RHS repeat-associated core domain-containing protein n=1 Tax=Enterovibrio makurazakiensis TaxID=2910232 RepID=UPI003D1D2163
MSSKQDYYNYIDEQFTAFPKLLDAYREQMNAWYLRSADYASEKFDLPSLLSMDKTIKAGDSTTTVGKDDDDYAVKALCPKSGELQIESVFQSIYNVPLGSIQVYVKSEDGKEVHSVTLDQQGKATVDNLEAGVVYEIVVDHKPTQAELDALFSNYNVMGTDLVNWLKGKWVGFEPEWKGFKSEWDHYFSQSKVDTVLESIGNFFEGIWDALKSLWNGIGEVYDLLKDPEKALENMSEGASEIISAIKNAASNAPKQLEKAMLFASDEAALYLLTRAIMIYLSIIPISGIINELAKLSGAVIADIIIGILGGLIISFIASPVVGTAYFLYRAAKTAAKAVQRILKPIADFMTDVFDMVKKLIEKASGEFKRVAINDAKGGSYRNGKVQLKTDNQKTSKLDSDTDIPDDSSPSTNPDDKPTQSEKNTECDKDPISMATGEELLSLQDGYLPGLIPFEWKRLYRTSAAELNQGLGFGWSHSLSHQLHNAGKDVIWTDAENKQTRFPKPSRKLPIITNTTAHAAAYFDENERIVTIAENGQRFHFKAKEDEWLLDEISDKYHHRLLIQHDNHNRVETVTTESGLRFRLIYQDLLLSRVDLYHKKEQDERPVWVFIHTQAEYSYNESEQLIAATNASGETERYQYDDHNVIQSRELAGGAIFYWEWQGEGKSSKAIRQYSNLSNIDTTYAWDESSNAVTLTNSNGTQQVYQHDENARLIKEVDAGGGEYLKEYDNKGQLLKEIDPLGNTTEYIYSKSGELQTKIAPNGLVTHYTYLDGRLVQVSQDQAQWDYKHDKLGNITWQRDPLGHVTRYGYNNHGLINAIHHPDGTKHSLVWNVNGELVEETTPQGEKIRYRYDILGRLRYRQDSLGIHEMHYDRSDRLTKHVLPGGKTRYYEYNAYSKVTKFTDEKGRLTQYEYRWPSHQVSKTINPDGTEVSYQYENAFQFLSDIVNENGEHYHIDYASTGHVSREVTFDGRELTYQYDKHTQLTSKTEKGVNGAELTTQYQYDSLGNVIVKTLPDDNEVRYEYDTHGRLVAVDDGHWPLAYQYDLLGRLTQEHQGWATLGYCYDEVSRLNAMVLPDGQRVDYRFDSGQLSQVNLNNQLLSKHTYQASGLELQRQQGALTSYYQHDDQGRLLEHRVKQKQLEKIHRKYHYNSVGNLTDIEDSERGQKQYHYDPLDRLTAVRGVQNEDFHHDPAGNLLLNKQANVEGNKLLFQGDSHYQYDEFGRLTLEARGKGSKLVSSYTYDCQHRLVQLEKPDGSKASYQYDAFGRRISKSITDKAGNTSSTEFIWQADKLLVETDNIERYQTYLYEYGSFRPLALIDGEGANNQETYFYQLDQLGTPLEITSVSGEVVWSVDYKAYGNLALKRAEKVTSNLRFQGQYFDEESGLHYNRHRYYSPATGRFITSDPIGLAGGLNSYQYVKNPLSWIDPLGLSMCKGDCPEAPNNTSIDLDNITPSDIPSFKSGEFNDWFDARTPEELAALYQNQGLKNKISDGLRGAGGKHEFMMVVEAPQWSRWGVKAQQVQEDFAIPISTLNEGGLAKGWKHSTGIKGSKAPGSKTAHNELQLVIRNSSSLDEYKTNMRAWAEKWINGGYDSLPSGFHD